MNTASTSRQQPAQDLAVLRAGDHHQHDRRASVDLLRAQGPEPRRRHRVHHLDAHAIGLAMRTIQYGDADVMMAGGGGDGHHALRARQLRPGQGAVDAQRCADGSEPPLGQGPRRLRAERGGGAVVLEELEHAKQRGARIYAELVGFGMSGDATT